MWVLAERRLGKGKQGDGWWYDRLAGPAALVSARPAVAPYLELFVIRSRCYRQTGDGGFDGEALRVDAGFERMTGRRLEGVGERGVMGAQVNRFGPKFARGGIGVGADDAGLGRATIDQLGRIDDVVPGDGSDDRFG